MNDIKLFRFDFLLSRRNFWKNLLIFVSISFFALSPTLVIAENGLTSAAYNGDLETVKALVANGADVNAQNDQGITALFMASYGGHIEVVKTLLSCGADVNTITTSGHDTPLIVASQNGFTDVVKELLKKRPDINAKNNRGATPLILASANGHTDVVKVLLTNGADVTIKTINDKMTALEAAKSGGHDEIVELLKKNSSEAEDRGKEPTLPKTSGVNVIELVSFEKIGVSKVFVSMSGNLVEKWPAVFSSNTEQLEVVLVMDHDAAYGVRVDTIVTSGAGELDLQPQDSPGRFSLFGNYYLTQVMVPTSGSFPEGVYSCVVKLNGDSIAKTIWTIEKKDGA